MTRPNPARSDHKALSLLESQVETEAAVASPPGVIPGPVPSATDVSWVTLKPGDPEVLLYHSEADDGTGIAKVPLWTSFAIPDPNDPAVIIHPLLEET